MNIRSLSIGMVVKHPQHGRGTVKSLTEHAAEIRFDSGDTRTLDPALGGLQPGEAKAHLEGLDLPLAQLLEQAAEKALEKVTREQPEIRELGTRWQGGKVVLHPADPTLQTKEVPLEVFFHKVVGVRNQLRVLEQKINAHTGLSDGDKVEMQQYISRCYGSLTTFNLLFKDKDGQFSSK